MSLVLIVAFVVLMVLAIPVGHGLIIAGALAVLSGDGVPLLAVVQQMFDQTQSFPMLALPFFMLAGALMMGGNLGRELLKFASEGMKRWTGGELSTTVVASVAFGGVSGRKKLSAASTRDATAAILNVKASSSVPIRNTLSIIHPVAIHPMVPSTRMDANSLLVSFIWRNATELARASVGAYSSEYSKRTQ